MLTAAVHPVVVAKPVRPALPRSRAHAAFQIGKGGKRVPILAATPSGESSSDAHSARLSEEEVWVKGAFPAYLQSEVDDFCAAWSDTVQEQDSKAAEQQGKTLTVVTKDNPVWRAIRHQASQEAAQEMLLSSFYHASILSHDSFARSLAFVLANRLADATLLATELFEIFHSILKRDETIKQAALLDIVACYERDPACTTYSGALLYFKGYHAIQTHRIGHVLWKEGRKVLALALQARISEVLAIDIHPGAVLGKGLLIDHGTGVVIGETCRVGDNVSIMQNVTLGGTGKTAGNRHPKVENNVLIGAGASVLGNITIGRGAQVAAGSLVLQEVPRRSMVAGSPAHVIGTVRGNAATTMQQVVMDGGPPQPDHSSDGEPLASQAAQASHQQHPTHLPPADSTVDAESPAAVHHSSNGSDNGSSPSHLLNGEEDCPEASAATQSGADIGSLADWALSAAAESHHSPHSQNGSNPRRSPNGSGGSHVPRASQPSPRRHAAPLQTADSFGASLAKPRTAAQAAPASRTRLPAVATLERPVILDGVAKLNAAWKLEHSPRVILPVEEELNEDVCPDDLSPSGCEPDWLVAGSGLDLLWDDMPECSSDTGSSNDVLHSQAAEHGLQLWRDMHNRLRGPDGVVSPGQPGRPRTTAAQTAALQRHNNRVLAEAGIMDTASPWAILSPFDFDAVNGAAIKAERCENILKESRRQAAWAKPAAAEAAARIMNPRSQSTPAIGKHTAPFSAAQAESDQDYMI